MLIRMLASFKYLLFSLELKLNLYYLLLTSQFYMLCHFFPIYIAMSSYLLPFFYLSLPFLFFSFSEVIFSFPFSSFYFVNRLVLYFQREGKGQRKRGRETSMCSCFLCAPYWIAVQACALTGNGNGTFWFAGLCSIH